MDMVIVMKNSNSSSGNGKIYMDYGWVWMVKHTSSISLFVASLLMELTKTLSATSEKNIETQETIGSDKLSTKE